MKDICIVGLGSIAKRHINNIRAIYPDVRIDILRHGRTAGAGTKENADMVSGMESEWGRMLYAYEELRDRYDAIFITNPTTMHLSTLSILTERSDAFFIEKPLRPLIHGEDISMDKRIISEADEVLDGLPKNKIYYVACPMRYTGIVQYVKNHIDMSSVYSIRAISSSYLPGWRPGTDYTRCYSARRELGGGVAADLIHEWDYISYLAGRPQTIYSVEARLSGLDIDVEDIAVYIGRYENRLAEVHLDYFGRSTRRELELLTDDDTIICDFIAGKITYLKSGEALSFDEKRDDYQGTELKHFFDIAAHRIPNDSDVNSAEALLRMLEKGLIQYDGRNNI